MPKRSAWLPLGTSCTVRPVSLQVTSKASLGSRDTSCNSSSGAGLFQLELAEVAPPLLRPLILATSSLLLLKLSPFKVTRRQPGSMPKVAP
eukprot:Skav203291  [mRNA]  locus=scaffold5484:20201:29028:- [translate_table: standard]